MKLVFIHGWSFDAGFWSPLHDALGRPESCFIECGYTGRPVSLALPDAPYLAITHSAGTLPALAAPDEHCRAIVAFNGFARFSQSDSYPEGVGLRLLARMRTRLTTDPAAVVMQFRQQFDPVIPCTDPDRAALLAGLDALIETDARAEALRWGSRLLSVSGTDDPLISPSMTRASFPQATLCQLAGGHLLPLTDPAGCAALVASCLEQTR